MVSEANPGLVQSPAGFWSDYAQAVESPVVPGELGPHLPPPPHTHTDSLGNGINGEMPPGGVPYMDDRATRRHWAEGVPQQHPEPWYQSQPFKFSIPANAVAGTALQSVLAGGVVTRQQLRFRAKSLRVDNLTPYTLLERESLTQIPPGVAGFPVSLDESLAALELIVDVGSGASGSAQTVYVRASERPMPPSPVVLPGASNGFATGNNGASLPSTSVQLNEGGVFSWWRGAAAGANGSALDGAALAIPPGATPASVTSAANAAGVLTIPAVAGQTNRLLVLAVSASAVSTAAGNLTVNFGGVTWTIPLAAGAVGGASTAIVQIPLPAGGVAATATNTAIVVTAPALGAAITSTINAAFVVG